jgi:hypothetical protein
MKKLLIFSLLIFLTGCQQIALKSENSEPVAEAKPVSLGKLKPQFTKVLLEAENKATPEGRRVLETGREMALIERAVVRGSCWDYANAVFNRAGYPYRGYREVVANVKKGEPLSIDFNSIQPGDFLSYVNHSFNNIPHSAIFVDWLDYDNKIALMLSYAGQKRHEPARYKAYDLSDVFYVARAHG